MVKLTKNKAVYEEDITGIPGKANAIVIADSIEEIKTVVRLSQMDIIPRGAGVNFTGSTVPRASVIIDMSKMNKIIEIDSSRKQAYIEAGTTIQDLNLELEKYNLEFPVDPLFSNLRTIGGLIATNSSGFREIRYGKIKNWIDCLEIIDSKGEVANVIKSDLDDFAGLEGLTGVIIRARLRLSSKKTRSFSILKSDSLDEILAIVKKMKLQHEVSSLFLANKKQSFLMGLEKRYHLFIEYEEDHGKINGPFYFKFADMKQNSYFFAASNGYTLLENPKLFSEDLKDFLNFLDIYDLPCFCDAGIGSVFACFNNEKKEIYFQAMEFIRKTKAIPSYNFGIGLTKKDFLEKNDKNLIRRIKERRDPNWKFQDNKVIDKENITPIIQEIKEGVEGIKEEKKEENKEIVKEPEKFMENFIEDQKIQEILEATPIEEKKEETANMKKTIALSEEEKEKIRKIAGGFFGNGR